MTLCNADEGALLLRELVAAFPNQKLSADNSIMYVGLFREHTIAEGRAAVRACVREGGEFFPPVPIVAARLVMAKLEAVTRRNAAYATVELPPVTDAEQKRINREGIAKVRAASVAATKRRAQRVLDRERAGFLHEYGPTRRAGFADGDKATTIEMVPR